MIMLFLLVPVQASRKQLPNTWMAAVAALVAGAAAAALAGVCNPARLGIRSSPEGF